MATTVVRRSVRTCRRMSDERLRINQSLIQTLPLRRTSSVSESNMNLPSVCTSVRPCLRSLSPRFSSARLDSLSEPERHRAKSCTGPIARDGLRSADSRFSVVRPPSPRLHSGIVRIKSISPSNLGFVRPACTPAESARRAKKFARNKLECEVSRPTSLTKSIVPIDDGRCCFSKTSRLERQCRGSNGRPHRRASLRSAPCQVSARQPSAHMARRN